MLAVITVIIVIAVIAVIAVMSACCDISLVRSQLAVSPVESYCSYISIGSIGKKLIIR